MGDVRPVDGRCRRLCPVSIPAKYRFPDDVDLKIVVGVGGDEVLRLTGAEYTCGSYRVDEENEAWVPFVGVECCP